MALLSNISAHGFGYTTQGQNLERISQTLESMKQLQRFSGHFYNWYDTTTLLPTEPRFISSVDSGNLSLSLMILETFLKE
jgi:cyclic beta-1,2-glucan synthetase